MQEGPVFIVTGGAGFVGSNLCAALCRRDKTAQLIVVDDFRTGSFANLVEAFDRAGLGNFTHRIEATCYSRVDWPALIAMHRPAAIFHLGAITDTTVMDEAEMLRVNTSGFVPLLHACLNSDTRLVYASSAATYGSPREGIEKRPFPVSAAGKPNNVYGFSKWLMESEHRRIAGDSPLVVGLRYFNVFGPGEARKGKMASMAYQLARQMLEGKRPRVFTPGDQARDQVYVGDVVDCTMAAAGLGERAQVRGGVYNLGSGVVTSFAQIADAMREGLGWSAADRPTEFFDMPASIRAFYQDYTCADMTATRDGLGWTPRHTPTKAMVQYAKMLRQSAGV